MERGARRKRGLEAVSGGEPRPMFSVVIPTFSRLDLLRRALAAWESQAPGVEFEVIVADDGSTDGTARFLAAWAPARHAYSWFSQANAGPARARNAALRRARGRYVFFAGDDILPTPRLLLEHACVHAREADPNVVVIGRSSWPPDLPLTATMRHIDGPGAEQFGFAWMRNGAEYDFRHFYTSNLSLSRELFEREPDGFSEEFPRAAYEDIELSYRLSRHGQRIVYAQHAEAWHVHPYDARGFFKRQVVCGAMAATFLRKQPHLWKWFPGRDLERIRLSLASERSESSGPAADSRERVETAEGAALEVAMLYDATPAPFLTPLLLGLFRHAVEKGFAEAWYEPDVAARLLLHSAREATIGPALGTFVGQALHHRVRLPDPMVTRVYDALATPAAQRVDPRPRADYGTGRVA